MFIFLSCTSLSHIFSLVYVQNRPKKAIINYSSRLTFSVNNNLYFHEGYGILFEGGMVQLPTCAKQWGWGWQSAVVLWNFQNSVWGHTCQSPIWFEIICTKVGEWWPYLMYHFVVQFKHRHGLCCVYLIYLNIWCFFVHLDSAFPLTIS